jgi:hypothetical protein
VVSTTRYIKPFSNGAAFFTLAGYPRVGGNNERRRDNGAAHGGDGSLYLR